MNNETQAFETDPDHPCFYCKEWNNNKMYCVEVCEKVGNVTHHEGKRDRRQKFYSLTRKGYYQLRITTITKEINAILERCDIDNLEKILELLKKGGKITPIKRVET